VNDSAALHRVIITVRKVVKS